MPQIPLTDTIYALASAAGVGGVAVIRVSGPHAKAGLEVLSDPTPLPQPRMAAVRVLRDVQTGAKLDEAMVIRFEGPKSFTGEDVVEYHLHGGRAVVDSVLLALSRMEGCRLANPGEFTRRAFENGRMDLTAAEAVADLIAAETEAQREQALAQMGGSLFRLYNGWAGRLARHLAYLEADLDFPDEDMPDGVSEQVMPQIRQINFEILQHLQDGRRGEILREGVKIAVVGAPNAGKSSLINALSQRDVAIVSDMPGTTRDIIEVHLNLSGYPVILADTAGLRQSMENAQGHDKIEQEGIKRALDYAQNADIVLLLFDGASFPSVDAQSFKILEDYQNNTLQNPHHNQQRLFAWASKADLMRVSPRVRGLTLPAFSAHTGQNLDALIRTLSDAVANAMAASERPYLTRARHREALEEAYDALLRAESAGLPELVAEDVRLAVRSLGRITGRVDVEDLLDIIFRDFCIGK